MNTKSIRTTLISTTFNESKSIVSWLMSLKSQTLLPDQVIIVDGGSTDETALLIQQFSDKHKLPIELIIDPTCNRSSSTGPIAKGRNLAIKHATHEHIICTDAGCTMDQDYVAMMARAFAGGSDYICGTYDVLNPNSYQLKLRSSFIPNFENVEFPSKFLPSSRSIGFSKELWKEVGGYPEQTFTGEDTLFASNLAKVAKIPVVQLRAKVYWVSPSSRFELLKKCYSYGYGDGQLTQNLSQYLLRTILFIFPPVWFAHNLLKGRPIEAWFIHCAQIAGFYSGMTQSLITKLRKLA
jgi:glycosyltransferase involved in cell wall biosynthesis